MPWSRPYDPRSEPQRRPTHRQGYPRVALPGFAPPPRRQTGVLGPERYGWKSGPVTPGRTPRSLQVLQLHVAEVNLGAFGLQQDLAARQFRAAALVDRLAVDHQLDRVALAGDLVLVPLADLLLDAVLHAQIVPRHLRVLPLGVHLQLEAVHQPEVAGVVRHQLGLDRLGPDFVRPDHVDEHPAVAALGDLVPPAPLHPQHVIAVLLLRDQVAVDAALADDHAVLDRKDLVRVGLALGV